MQTFHFDDRIVTANVAQPREFVRLSNNTAKGLPTNNCIPSFSRAQCSPLENGLTMLEYHLCTYLAI